MDLIKDIVYAILNQDAVLLSNPKLLWIIYGTLFMILLLENGLLPAAFLPGDSLLILVGTVIANSEMSFPLVICILTAGASLGCWLSYLQGKWLGNTKVVQGWLSHLPEHYHQRAHNLFHKHGLAALLIARFLAFVRTLLPTIAGLSGLSSTRFQFFNWLSGFLWVIILTSIGYFFSKTPLFQRFQSELMLGLVILPIFFLVSGLIGSIWVVWRKRRSLAAINKKQP